MKLFDRNVSHPPTFRTLFPALGARITKTSAAVFLCLVIYALRGYKGSAINSTIAAIVCMQQYVDASLNSAINRVLSTVLGGIWALIFLLCVSFFPELSSFPIIVYALMSLGVLVTLYSTVVLRKTEYAALATIVFICIVLAYPDIEDPINLVLGRLFDNLIGIFVAIGVNSVRLPRRKHPEKLFFMRTKDLTPTRFAHIPSRILFAMNRFYSEGARICLISEYAPAFFISQMGTIKVNTPLIMMDGAVLYDTNEQEYLSVVDIPHSTADVISSELAKLGISYNVNAIRENSMLVFHIGELNKYESELYSVMRRSPYRNYVFGNYGPQDRITHFKATGSEDRINSLAVQLGKTLPHELRYVIRTEDSFDEPVASLYIYSKDATVRNMKARLTEMLSAAGPCEPVDIFSLSESGFDNERDALTLFSRLRSIYEPVAFLPVKKQK